MEIEWVCLFGGCRHRNISDFLKTASPSCGICGQVYWWDEITSFETMEKCNHVLDDLLLVIDELEAEDRGGDDFQFVLAYPPIWTHGDNDVQNAVN